MMQISNSILIALADDGSAMAQSSPAAERMDEAAFHSLYRETAPTLRAYIRRASGDAALADDLLQETFFRLLRAEMPKLERPQLKAYLYRIASSLLTDHWRRLKRERQWSLRTIFRTHTSDDVELGQDMSRIFASLKPPEQTLLWLAHVEGFDHQEIAQALQLKEKSVRVLLFRARRKLGNILTKHGFGPEVKL